MGEFGTINTMMLGITEDQIVEVDASEAEVVSSVIMAKIKDIVVNIRPDGVTFNTTCIRSMTGVIYIQMMMDRNKHRLYVAPADEFDRDSRKWCTVKDDKRSSRKITGRDFGDRIYKMMGWSKGYSYRVIGYPAKQAGVENEYLMAFDLDEFDQRLLTEKGMTAAGVSDEDLGADAARIRADMAKEKERKEKAREEAKATGKRSSYKKKVKYHGGIADGAFGTARKDHVNRIEVKTLDETESLLAKDSKTKHAETTEPAETTDPVIPTDTTEQAETNEQVTMPDNTGQPLNTKLADQPGLTISQDESGQQVMTEKEAPIPPQPVSSADSILNSIFQ